MSTNGLAEHTGVPTEAAAPVDELMYPAGTHVEVRRRFDQHWAKGFVVEDHCEQGYRLRRLSDGALLPVEFGQADVRKERKKSTWWY
jgi:hypothetical protein